MLRRFAVSWARRGQAVRCKGVRSSPRRRIDRFVNDDPMAGLVSAVEKQIESKVAGCVEWNIDGEHHPQAVATFHQVQREVLVVSFAWSGDPEQRLKVSVRVSVGEVPDADGDRSRDESVTHFLQFHFFQDT